MLCPGIGQSLVPKAVRAADFVFVWIHWEETGRNFDPAKGILVDEFFGGLAGIVWCIESA